MEHATSVPEFCSKLSKLQRAVNDIKQILPIKAFVGEKGPIDAKLRGPARLAAIQEKYFIGALNKMDPVHPASLFYLLMHTLLAADEVCEFVRVSISDNQYPTYEHGFIWNWWIRALTIILKEHGLPYRARNDSDKQKGQKEEMSPFVRLVDKLQKCIPKSAQRSTAGPHALAKAVTRARQNLDSDCKFEETIDDIFPGLRII